MMERTSSHPVAIPGASRQSSTENWDAGRGQDLLVLGAYKLPDHSTTPGEEAD